MRFLLAFAVTTLCPYLASAQVVRATVADSLMERWVEIYNTDDAAAIDDFYATDITTSSDGRPGVNADRASVLAGSIRQMGRTENLQIETLYSYEEEDEAYHIGRFTIDVEGEPTTGAYLFFFRKDPDARWRLRYTYYVHDPAARLEEFLPERR